MSTRQPHCDHCSQPVGAPHPVPRRPRTAVHRKPTLASSVLLPSTSNLCDSPFQPLLHTVLSRTCFLFHFRFNHCFSAYFPSLPGKKCFNPQDTDNMYVSSYSYGPRQVDYSVCPPASLLTHLLHGPSGFRPSLAGMRQEVSEKEESALPAPTPQPLRPAGGEPPAGQSKQPPRQALASWPRRCNKSCTVSPLSPSVSQPCSPL